MSDITGGGCVNNTYLNRDEGSSRIALTRVPSATFPAGAQEFLLVDGLLPVVGAKPLLTEGRVDDTNLDLLQSGRGGDLAVGGAAPPDHHGLFAHEILFIGRQTDRDDVLLELHGPVQPDEGHVVLEGGRFVLWVHLFALDAEVFVRESYTLLPEVPFAKSNLEISRNSGDFLFRHLFMCV